MAASRSSHRARRLPEGGTITMIGAGRATGWTTNGGIAARMNDDTIPYSAIRSATLRVLLIGRSVLWREEDVGNDEGDGPLRTGTNGGKQTKGASNWK
uniref:Uncharacterized protein n=1 Tax=Pristionchus pacificus TaxID=54126 RepID=A0A2A6C5B3_PRIPA|eukprot:PDM73402.1 hypothetical protein PRIPAC_40758 [Pristionchus pacificus]